MTGNIDAPVVSVAGLKLELFRLIDRLPEDKLKNLHDQLCVIDADHEEEAYANGFGDPNVEYESDEPDPRDLDFKPVVFTGDIDEGYAAMFADEEREKEAKEWIEGTLNWKELTSDDL